MLFKLSRWIFATLAMTLSGYSLLTKNVDFMPYLMLLVGASLLMTGVAELQKDRKGFWGYMSMMASLFAFYASIQGFLLS
ncbi:hypothetical protein AWH48_20145 [Domibacillus aminovorans]|uniref:DUF3953 domain-containing protein n=1 Tax=Domibacillus aminovorans TaxID=29332 RepID=A0A177KR14_9BACI|nr:DUF3953 domain-containing protein [Domibacillus aminovorans]OAH55405.1 hypothetical protein AWH48_20145 [Domibacillus aminovorans]